MGRKRTGGGNDERRITIDDAWVRLRFDEGKTAAEMAALLGCSTHPVKQVMRRLNLQRPAKRRPGVGVGDSNPAWKGGRRKRRDGYVLIWTPAGERLEHQVVMEKTLGRSLQPGEVVHHINGVKDNNTPENLELTTQSDHIRGHLPAMHKARYGK